MSTNFLGIREKRPNASETPDARNMLIGNRLKTRPGISKVKNVATGKPIMEIGTFKSDDCVTDFNQIICGGELVPLPLPFTIEFDGHTDDGGILGEDASYATARATSRWAFTTDENVCGQRFIFGTYRVHRSFILFDTSSIPDDAIIADVKLKMAVARIDFTEIDFDVRIHKHDWDNPINDDNREANYDGALTATLDQIWRNTSGIANDTYYTSPSLDTAWVNKTGFTKYAIVSANDVDNNAPTINNDERIVFWAGHQELKPILIVDYHL